MIEPEIIVMPLSAVGSALDTLPEAGGFGRIDQSAPPRNAELGGGATVAACHHLRRF